MTGGAGPSEAEAGTTRLAFVLAMAMFVLVVDTSLMNVSISAVVGDLHTTVSGVQSAIALEALGQLGPAGADPVLIGALDSPLFPTRWTAAIALRRAGTRASLDELLQRLEQSPAGRDETLAVALAGPLADGASEEQLARVLQLFDVSSGAVKDALIDALAGVPGARGVQLLEDLASRTNKASRAKVAEAPPKQNVAPGIKEQVTLRLDQDVLEHFQSGGPGWQDRINEALRKAVGK